MVTILPLKPKRSAGGFFTVFAGDKFLWVSEDYHLYRNCLISKRDEYELEQARREFIESKDTIQHKIDGCTYVVRFNCDLPDDIKIKVIERLHNGKTYQISTYEIR